MDNLQLTKIFEGSFYGDILDEICLVAAKIFPDFNLSVIRDAHYDLAALFSGKSSDYQKTSLPYHNLRHSQMVVLATVRCFHGLHNNGVHFQASTLLKGLLAAYFHDAGLLVHADEAGIPAPKLLAGHEERSIKVLTDYLKTRGIPEKISHDCGIIIRYTDLNKDPEAFTVHAEEVQLAGQVVGSADILAQMADRYYLEQLPLLYYEQEEGGVNTHNSAIELMEHTANFYHNVVMKRMLANFACTSQAMKSHFRERYGIDRDLYQENITKNIEYLDTIIIKCRSIGCLDQYLKRKPPAT
jgi:hypothetical protein